MFCSGNRINTTIEILQNALHTLQEWAHKSGSIFSPYKSQCIKFNHNQNTNQKLYLNNIEIPFQKTMRIL